MSKPDRSPIPDFDPNTLSIPDTVETIEAASQAQFDRLALQVNELWGIAEAVTDDTLQVPVHDLAVRGVAVNGVHTYAGREEDGTAYAIFTRFNHGGAIKDVTTLSRTADFTPVVIRERLTLGKGTWNGHFEHHSVALAPDMTTIFESVDGEYYPRAGVLTGKRNYVSEERDPLRSGHARVLSAELQRLQATLQAETAPRKNRLFGWLGKLGRRGAAETA